MRQPIPSDYMTGFGNAFSTEAEVGALPKKGNSPQRPAFGLYAEQFSATAFTAPRNEAKRSWLYRIHPMAGHGRFDPIESGALALPLAAANPNRLRWDPSALPTEPTDFLAGLTRVAANDGKPRLGGATIYIYAANRSMDRAFFNADGEMLIVPELGAIRLVTELGILDVAPGEIVVAPRGIHFKVLLLDAAARGYVCENHGPAFRLPELGAIGSNGLAYARDFLTPVAWYEDVEEPVDIVQKFQGALWQTRLGHSPFNVVAWHGNLAPYKYDLKQFNVLGTVSFDHPDPSIFTVLTAPTDTAGIANVDFVVFAPRWMVGEDTFRLPWFHRNVMNEYMGLIYGQHDAKASGFVPGGASLHSAMNAHGPDAESTRKAIAVDLEANKYDAGIAFMFETSQILRPTEASLTSDTLQGDYDACWSGIDKTFSLSG